MSDVIRLMYGKTDGQKDRVCSNISLLYPLLIKRYYANLLHLHVLCAFVCCLLVLTPSTSLTLKKQTFPLANQASGFKDTLI